MKRTVMIYALVLLLALTAIVVVAQGRRANLQPRPADGPFAMCQKTLGLSQDQVADMTGLRASCMNDTASLRTDIQTKMKEIADLWAAADPDLQQIKLKAGQADQIRAKIRDKCIDASGAILKVLTPEQRAACAKQRQSGQCCCGMCGGPGMGMGMGGMNGGGCIGMGCQGAGAGMGMGRGMGRGMGQGMGQGMGPNGTGCPMRP